jgi:hypothetical protein
MTLHHDLRHYVRVYDADLEAALCHKMIDSFAALERFQQYNGRNLRRGLEESEWTELNVTRLSEPDSRNKPPRRPGHCCATTPTSD